MVYKFLGDIHGKFPVCRKHYDELEDGEVLVQIGDFGFNDTYQSILPFTDANKLQIVAGNHDCLCEETEILTKNGWKFINDLKKEDLIFSVSNSLEGSWNKINTIIRKTHTGYFYNKKGKHIDISCTDKHRFIYKTERSKQPYKIDFIKNINHDQVIHIPCAASNLIKDNELITDDEIKLLAWIYTDGYFKRKGNYLGIRISQRPSKIEYIENLLNKMNILYTKSTRIRNIKFICGKQLKNPPKPECVLYLKTESLKNISWRKYFITKENLDFMYDWSSRQFLIFLHEAIKGDGTTPTNGKKCGILYGSKERLNEIQKFCVINNIRTSLYTYRKTQGRLNITFNTNDTMLRLKPEKTYVINKPVWCIQTDLQNFCVRKNGKVFFTGNCYDSIGFWPHYLGDFGILPATRKKVMFCRGAYSIDKDSRTPYYDWWPEEELTIPKFDEFLGQYEKFKPHVMVTHDVPADVIGKYCLNIFGASRTEQYLQEAFDIHKPEMWIHGHFHLSMRHIYKRCKFVSLGINELFTIDL